MTDRMQLASRAQDVIRQDLENRASAGTPAGAVFLSSELLYAIKALPDPALRFDWEHGETIFDVPVIRFESDDMSVWFTASPHYTDGRPETPAVRHRPYYAGEYMRGDK